MLSRISAAYVSDTHKTGLCYLLGVTFLPESKKNRCVSAELTFNASG